jgi:hypothetical protein
MALAMTNPKGIKVPWPPPEGGCPPWCDHPEWHKPSDHPDDRNHLSEPRIVALSLEPAIDMGCRNGAPTWEPHSLEVYHRQRSNEDTPVIILAERDEYGVKLNVREVRELVQALLAAIEIAEERS